MFVVGMLHAMCFFRLDLGTREYYHRAAAAPPVFRYALWTQKRVFTSTEPNTPAAAHTSHDEERTDIQVIALSLQVCSSSA
jgi:hypothetical protein